MAITRITTPSITDDAVDNTKLDLASNYAFTGTITGAGGVMTPVFRAYQSGAQNISSDTTTVLNIDTENFDTDGAFNTSTYRFQPTVSGKYFLYANQGFDNLNNYDTNFVLYIRKNGSSIAVGKGNANHQDIRFTSTVESLNGSTDYVDIAVFQSTGATQQSTYGETITFFGGYKIIE